MLPPHIGHRQVLLGLIGGGIQLSKSPALHEREGRRQGLDLHYELIDTELPAAAGKPLNELLRAAEARRFVGLNITHPFKQLVLSHLHDLSDDARMLGAVNTVALKDGHRIGHNTDWYGFYESFHRGLPDVERGRVLLLGAGGAGVAVAHAAIKLGIKRLEIYDQDRAKATALAGALTQRFRREVAIATTDPAKSLREGDGLIHATPTGMRHHPGVPIDQSWLEARHWVADIVYMPLVTELLKLAQQRGCRVLSGGSMAVFQAAEAFRIFTGRAADEFAMEADFLEICRQENEAMPP